MHSVLYVWFAFFFFFFFLFLRTGLLGRLCVDVDRRLSFRIRGERSAFMAFHLSLLIFFSFSGGGVFCPAHNPGARNRPRRLGTARVKISVVLKRDVGNPSHTSKKEYPLP